MPLRLLFISTLALALSAQSPLEELLAHGPLAQAETTLKTTTDGERFGLGAAQTLRALEHLGQGLHRYGSKAQMLPILRLPVPTNPAPEPVDARKLRHLLETFRTDLAKAEQTLGRVGNSDFKVPIPLGRVMLDLDGDGKATDRLMDLARRLRGDLPRGLEGDLEVAFDATDAAWLQGYTHLMMGLTELFLAVDLETHWELIGPLLFSEPMVKATAHRSEAAMLHLADPKALSRLRRHLLTMVALSRVTWSRALAETDDDREWLPSPTQANGVLGVPVREEMVTAWLAMVGDLEAVLEGRLLLPNWGQDRALGFDFRAFLEQPPSAIPLERTLKQGPLPRYLRKGKRIDLQKMTQAMAVFGGEFMGMAIWFN